jgi:hypothetical protein
MYLNKLLACLSTLVFARVFLWRWHDAGKTQKPGIGLYSVDLRGRPRLLMIARWFLLACAAMMLGVGIFVLVAQP